MGCGKSVPAVSEKPEDPTPSSVQKPTESLDPAITPPSPTVAEINADNTKEVNFKPIHSAIRWNKPISEIEQLLSSSAAVNCVDASNGNRPIHIAAQNGHEDIIKLLIAKDVELNAKNAKGNTGIHMAVGYDYYTVAKLLIAAGADETLTNDLDIPSNLGLEGDKAMGIAALVCAESSDDVDEALNLCEDKIEKLNKINFVSAGLKAKKVLGTAWTPEHQAKFKGITVRLA